MKGVDSSRPAQVAAVPRPVARRRLPGWLIPVLGYAVSIACMVWVYQGFDWKEQWPRLRAIDWRWVTLAAAADIIVYICQGFRWSLLLRPILHVRPWKATQAVYIGLFANEVLPFRSGEIIRCYLLSRWTGLRVPVVLSSALIERLLDGVWLALGLWVAGKFVKLPGYLTVGARVLVIALAVAGILVLFAVLRKPDPSQAGVRNRWSSAIKVFVDAVHMMGSSASMLFTFLLSLLYLALQIIPIWALMVGYHMDLSFWAAGVVLVILRLGTIVPQAPSNVGSFQALTIVSLTLFGIPRGEATGFATVLFLVVTVPLWMGGFVALVATRMRLTQIQQEAEAAADEDYS